jgi:hypothetical protein
MHASIEKASCPHLGRCDDAGSFYTFPTPANCCHVGDPPLTIEPPHQGSVCLGQDWGECPRYKAALAGDEIRHSTTPSRLRKLAERAPSGWSIAAVVVVAGLILGGLAMVLRLQSPVTAPSRAASDFTVTESDPSSSGASTAHISRSPARALASAGESPVALPRRDFTPSPSEPSSAGGGPTPMAMPGTVSAQTTTTRPSRTPARTPAPTPTPVPTWTPSPAPTHTPNSTATRRPSPAPKAATLSPVPTGEPSATSPRLPAPTLLTPSERQDFTEDSEVVLAWRAVGVLPPDARFVITVAYTHLGETWHDEVPWTRETSWTLSEHRYLLDLSDDGQYQWSVQIMRQTGIDANGKPVGVSLSPPSDVRTLSWRRAVRGGGGPGDKPPPPPP